MTLFPRSLSVRSSTSQTFQPKQNFWEKNNSQAGTSIDFQNVKVAGAKPLIFASQKDCSLSCSIKRVNFDWYTLDGLESEYLEWNWKYLLTTKLWLKNVLFNAFTMYLTLRRDRNIDLFLFWRHPSIIILNFEVNLHKKSVYLNKKYRDM